MTERPILFSGPMVRALLAGTKTQTRRVIKDQSIGERFSHMTDDGLAHLDWLGDPCCGTGVWNVPEYSARVSSPYGKPGDRLWVREAFAGSIAYERHGYPLREWGNKLWYVADGEPRSGQWTRPRPSIHMPRSLSRITLEITGVRVERLQDISEADAQAEGCALECMTPTGDDSGSAIYGPGGYMALWESLNGAGSWDTNPWVWVVEFKRVTPAVSQQEQGE